MYSIFSTLVKTNRQKDARQMLTGYFRFGRVGDFSFSFLLFTLLCFLNYLQQVLSLNYNIITKN